MDPFEPKFRLWLLFLPLLVLAPQGVLCGTSEGGPSGKSLSEYFDIAEQILKETPGVYSDLQKCARAVKDAEGALRFVRANVRYVPYEGCVRGALGALYCGSGNSLDKSLLLASLLKLCGYRTRICGSRREEGPLSEVEQLRAPEQAPIPYERLSRITGLSVPALRAYVADRRRTWAVNAAFLLGRVGARLKQILPLIEGRIAESGASEAAAGESMRFWVECEREPGKWIRMDPLSEGLGGKLPAEPDLSFAAAEVPERLCAKLRVVIKLEKEKLLEFEKRTADYPLSVLTLGFVPTRFDFLKELNDPKAAGEALKKLERFQPVARLGSEIFVGRRFDLQGRVYEKGGGGRIASARRIGRSIGGLFGGRSEEETQKTKESWSISYEISLTGPGLKRVFRRKWVRSAEPEVTRVRLLSTASFLLSPGEVKAEVTARRSLEKLISRRAVFEKAARGEISWEKDWAAFEHDPPELAAFARLERAALSWFPPEAGAFLPFHLVGWEERTDRTQGREGERIEVRKGFDLPAAPLGCALKGRARFETTVKWGIILTELERLLVELISEGPVRSASRAFFLAENSGTPLELLRSEKDLGRLGLPAELSSVLKSELKKGLWVIVPRRLAAGAVPAYYAIDPRTGEILGRGEGGRGQALTEQAETEVFMLQILGAMSAFADLVKCIWGTILMPLAGAERAEMQIHFCKCFVKYAVGGLFTLGGEIANPSPSWGLLGMNIAVEGVPFSSYGGLAGALGTWVGNQLCGGR